ncbi:hypothetical protein Pyn_34394 [Prunus yedoensis var. nudiflora]|uniref:Uncharacterized protein n=1 Tax=Prunus yedoensis var. nudiflora TaxID=2094558 RepID=A0A314U6Z1_PRUYE|nr:hypothetical protein Pyn_34394 [Prunus yedoensis var. nudiflora]
MEGERGSKEAWWGVLGDFRSFRQLGGDSTKVSIKLSEQGKQRKMWGEIARKLLGLQVKEKACSLKVVGCVVLGRRGPIYSCWGLFFSKKP